MCACERVCVCVTRFLSIVQLGVGKGDLAAQPRAVAALQDTTLYGRTSNLKLYGNEVYNTAWSLQVILKNRVVTFIATKF